MIQKYLITALLIFYTLTTFGQTLNDKWLYQIDKGKEEYAINNYSNALTFFTKASRLIPTDTTAYVYMLDCSYKTQQADVFFQSFSRLLLLDYESARIYNLAIKTSIEVEKDYQKAVIYVEAAKQIFTKDKNILMADIMIYFQYGDYDAAMEKLVVYSELFPRDKKALDLIYKIQYVIRKDPASAIKTLEKAQQLFPNDQEYVKKEVNIYLETGQMDAAEEKFKKLIELNPTDAKHYYNLSLILYNKGDYQQSVELALKAIELKPDFLEAIFNVGTFYYHRALQYNEMLNKMTPIQYTYKGQGRDIEDTAKSLFELAKPYFEQAIKLNTEELGAFENLNTINVLLGNIEQNQVLTDPYFTDLENEDKHKVYPDYELVDFSFNYPDGQLNLKKGQNGNLVISVVNIGELSIEDAEIRLFEPFVNPMISFDQTINIPTINSGDTATISVPFTYSLNNVSTVGIEKAEGAQNLVRFFVSGTDGKYTDLQQVDIAMGKVILATVDSSGTFSETIDIDFTPAAKAVNFLLVIGIDNYIYWQPLTNAVNDTKNVKEVLINQYEVNKENVFELYNEDATKTNIINELIKIKRELTNHDNLIIYYAGHGDYNTSTDEGAWIPVDANINSEDEYLNNTTLLSFLNSLDTKHTFLIADACFSGSLFVSDDEMSYKPNNDRVKSRWGFTSGNIEYVADGEQNQGSPFAKYFVEALTENQRDFIAVTELISYVKFKVRNNAIQTPIGRPLKLEGNEGGEFLLYLR